MLKIQIASELLRLATSRVQGAIGERNLGHIGLHAQRQDGSGAVTGQLQIAATDRILAIYNNLSCEVQSPGTVFVPARLFSEVVKELPDGPVSLVQELAHIVLTAGAANEFTMKLPVLDDLAWREAPVIDGVNAAELPAARLSYMIEQVQFCVAHDSPRNYGAVAFLHKPMKDSCRLVGTDGFRLSFCELALSTPDSFLNNGICLSKRGLTELQRMCGEGFETVRVAVASDETTLLAEVPDYQIFIRLSSVKYPNYMGVVPERKMSGVLVSRPHLQNVARRVLLAADKSRALQLSFSDSSLTLNSKTMGSSESHETVPLVDYHGPQFDIAVNGKFLTDVFTTTASDSLTLQFNQDSNEDPIVIVPRTEPADCRSKHVLVPIKQSE